MMIANVHCTKVSLVADLGVLIAEPDTDYFDVLSFAMALHEKSGVKMSSDDLLAHLLA